DAWDEQNGHALVSDERLERDGRGFRYGDFGIRRPIFAARQPASSQPVLARTTRFGTIEHVAEPSLLHPAQHGVELLVHPRAQKKAEQAAIPAVILSRGQWLAVGEPAPHDSRCPLR